MIVQKFGGTSVGSAKRIKNVAEIIIEDKSKKIVIVSAMSGMTNELYSIIDLLQKGKHQDVSKGLVEIKNKFHSTIDTLIADSRVKESSYEFITNKFQAIKIYPENNEISKLSNRIIALGEICTSYILWSYINSIGIKASFFYAPDFMVKGFNNEPEMQLSSLFLEKQIAEQSTKEIIITQGFICSDMKGELSNFGRGGSDYSATIIGSILNAEEIQIWSDQEGILNNDPRYVENTYLLSQVSYTEAEELAYFGAKILHPQSISPAKKKGIKIIVKNTFNPNGSGTEINSFEEKIGIKAIAAKDNISILRIKSGNMVNAFGFLKKIFQVFEDFKTPVDVITTSEVSVSVTIDNDFQLNKIAEKLKRFGEIEIEKQQSIVCLVGDFDYNRNGVVASVLDAIKDIPLKMISHGASKHNMTFVVNTNYRTQILNLINEKIFNTEQLCIAQ